MNRRFTLLELLIVIAVIGILVTLLMPSLAKAKEAAKTTVCMSNQKQMSYGIFGLAPSFNNRFIGHYFDGYFWNQRVDGFNRGEEPPDGPAFRARHEKGRTIWTCPSLVNPWRVGVVGFVHTGMNNSNEVGGGGRSAASIGPKPGGFITKIEEPVDVALLGDTYNWVGQNAGNNTLQFSNYVFRHSMNVSMNFTFVDGHVENLRMNRIGTSKNELDRLLRGDWR